MERFKAVEKAMKTKAYSKEGLSAAAKLDPKEQAKLEASEFLSSMVDDLEQQIETLEAEGESIQATMKKGKGHSAKADRMAEIERVIERHKWHQGKLELIRRSLENGGVETEQVTDLEESIRYYVTDGMNEDFIEDDEMYDELNLEEEEDAYGVPAENDKGSSQDNQSVHEDTPEPPEPVRAPSLPTAKTRPEAAAAAVGRRPSTQMKSPLPTLATVHTPLPTVSNGTAGNPGMKPASVPARPAEGLKYASAAAAAAASDKNNVGIAPLPPPASTSTLSSVGISPLPPAQTKASTTSSPSSASIQLVSAEKSAAAQQTGAPPINKTEGSKAARGKAPMQQAPAPEPAAPSKGKLVSLPSQNPCPADAAMSSAPQSNGVTNGVKVADEEKEEESIYHLPASLRDLVDSFEATKKRPAAVSSPATLRMQAASQAQAPDSADAEAPRSYQPEQRFNSTSQYPQEPLSIFDDPRLYSRIDPDTLFYVFYYKQGTYQQYLAAKALKDQSWRFHKQYQTWFQRHEEPKSITEEFEQGTYRFFDYESTW
jgi:CCR4-NOT transcription complex subunit 3